MTLADGLAGWYDASIFGDAQDGSGSGNDGTLSGGASVVADTDGPGAGVEAFLMGSGGFLDTGILPSNGVGTGTAWSLWAKPTTVSSARYYIGNNTNTNWYARVNNPTNFRVIIPDSGAVDFGPHGMTVDVWHHVVVNAEDGANLEVYIDGAAVGTPVPWTKGTLSEFPLVVGRATTGEQGSFDGVRLYSRSLLPAEITEIYNGGRAFDHRSPSGPPPAHPLSGFAHPLKRSGVIY